MADTIEKVSEPGCYVDERTFINLVERICKLEEAQTKEVDVSYLFHASVDPVDIHNAGTTLGITQTRADTGWSAVANGADYAGSPDSVDVSINIQVDENAGSNYWALPEIIVERNGTRIGSASMVLMQNNGAYSAQSTLSAMIVDPNPGANPQYRFFLEDDDNRTIEAIPQDHAHVTIRAHEKCEVLAPAPSGQ